MYEIDRLKTKARAGEPLTAIEGLWLVEKVNQLRDALATSHAAATTNRGLEVAQALAMLAAEAVPSALRDACADVGETIYERGNKSWEEWGLNPSAQAIQASQTIQTITAMFEDFHSPMSRQQRRALKR